jgi:hypothetical protein
MFCHKCGTQLQERSEFCHACGTRAIDSTQAAASKPEEQRAESSTSQGGTTSPTAALRVAVAALPSPAYVAAPPTQQALAPRHGLSTPGVWSIICSIAAVFLVPPLFGAIALYLSYRAKKSGDAAGDMLMIGAIVAAIVGMVFGMVVWAQLVG